MEDDEMKLQNAQAKRRMSKAAKCQAARNIATEQAKHMRMPNYWKPFEIHILCGLPGSGKTTFAEELHSQKSAYSYHVWGDDFAGESLENAIKTFFENKSYEIGRETCGTFACGEQVIFDGLMLTNEDVQKLVKLYVDEISKITWDGEKIPAKFIIHQWNEDREACLKNDLYRLSTGTYERTDGATATIEYAKYEIIDIDALRQMYPDYSFEYVEHTVEAHSEQEIIMRDHCDGMLISERWCVGGDVCNCWGSHWVIDHEDDPVEFTEYINLVNHFCPNISHENYRKLWDACVDEDYDAESDYYGGCLHYRWYTCNLERLFEKMEEMGVIEIEQ